MLLLNLECGELSPLCYIPARRDAVASAVLLLLLLFCVRRRDETTTADGLT
jgi:hypothetical protein